MAVTINASTTSGVQIASDTSGEIQFQDDGTTNLTIKPTGNVLIGRTTDSTIGQGVKLDIVGGINTSSLITTSGSIGVGVASPTAALHLKAGVSGASGAPLKFTSGTNATVEAGAVEYDGTTFTMTPSTNFGRAAIPLTIYTSGIGTSGITLNTDYALFPSTQDTITLPIGTYLVKLRFIVTVSGSTVSATCNLNLRGGGSAVGTLNLECMGKGINTAAASYSFTGTNFIQAATALGTAIVVTDAQASNPRGYILYQGTGLLKITTAGTIIPSYQFSATLTSGTTTLYADNHMIIQQLDTQSAAAFGPAGAGWG